MEISANYKKHFPVMLKEVLQYLAPKEGEVYVDATFGNGGYSEAILNSCNCKVIALDRDPNVMSRAVELKQKFGNRFDFRAGCFGQFADLVHENINGAVFDIGVSSMQLDEAQRGFSFSKDAPLDMRMSQSGESAADLVNNLSEKELAYLIYNYGEERKSRQIAQKIVNSRKNKPILTTKELAEIIYSVIPFYKGAINPATRTFQALRIAVNNELEELKKGLFYASARLNNKGRLVVVDFHSLEDRIVKQFFKNNTKPNRHQSRYKQNSTKDDDKFMFYQCSKAISPSNDEIKINARSRSAKLRCAIKNDSNIINERSSQNEYF